VSAGTTVNAAGSSLGSGTVTVAANGILNATGSLTLGGLAGAGTVHANGFVLYVGSNNSSTSFTGVIDGGPSPTAPTSVSARYFRFTPTVRLTSANSVQFSELQFFNGATRLTGGTASNPSNGNPPNEIPSKILDNDVN